MKDLIISLTEVQRLKEELNNLNKEYLELYQNLEDLNKEKEYLESLYMAKLGTLIFIKLESEVEYRKLKRKLALIIQRKNLKKKIDINEIDELLKIELRSFYEQLDSMKYDMKNSRIYFELPTLTEEEMQKVKEIFRKLAKKLHPDINKNLTEEDIALWNNVKEAYENNDLVTLIVLEGLVGSIEIDEDIKIKDLESNILKIKDSINSIRTLITESVDEFPLSLRDLIHNNEYIKDRKESLTTEIKNYKQKVMELQILIDNELGGI